MYDIFFIGSKTDKGWHELRQRFPFVKISTDFESAQRTSLTKFLWIVWNDVQILDTFSFDYQIDEWSEEYTHLFKNGDVYDGICLLHKDLHVSKKEVEHRFFVNKKEIDIVASVPRPYDKFSPSTYDEYLECAANSTTDMFWTIWEDVDLDYNLDYYVPAYDTYHKKITHIFLNGETQDGICLFSKTETVTKKEFDHRFFVNKKEVDIVASTPKPYPVYHVDTYEDYQTALESSPTQMFWCIWKNVEVIDPAIYSLYFSYHNSYDRNENHVWSNLCNDTVSYHGGIILASKNKPISKKEIEHRFIINRKEHEQTISRYRYPRYIIRTYDDYLEIAEKETSPLFWCVWNNVEILDDSIFDFYYNPTDGRYDADREMHHVYKHIFRNEETYHNGVFLATTKHTIGKREFDHKYVITRKEHDEVISKLRPYDIVFISYNEPDADDNFKKLKERFPRVKRIHGVKGIHQAHIEAAKLCDTEMVWIVDGDAHIVEDFDFSHEANTYEIDTVHVWQSQNPINNLVYGYGGVKLLPRDLTLNMNVDTADMTTSISDKFKSMPDVSNITAFNTDEFSTWKSAFRECVKLASKTIKGQVDEETEKRLEIWCTQGDKARFGRYAISGACAGRDFGYDNSDKPDNLKLINNFEWLYEKFRTDSVD